jgi:hypothetical protein
MIAEILEISSTLESHPNVFLMIHCELHRTALRQPNMESNGMEEKPVIVIKIL